MDILNKKERMSAFLLFLLMFVITTGTLMAAIFFNFKLPLKENEVLKAENEKILNEFNFHKEFTDKIEHVSKMVVSLDKAPESFQFIEQDITHELVRLKDKLPADSDESIRLYDNYIITVNQLISSKRQLSQLSDGKKEMDDLKEQLKAYEQDNKDLQRELALARQLSMRQ